MADAKSISVDDYIENRFNANEQYDVDKSSWTNDLFIQKMNKDLKNTATKMSRSEARDLVYYYYSTQRDRVRLNNQLQMHGDRCHELLQWLAQNVNKTEKYVGLALDVYSNNSLVGRWARSIKGIGPVISSGLISHIDIHQAPTAGHIWSFAGYDPTREWKKGEKRPWNADLKVICWKAGESFVKVSNNTEDVYGKIYKQRKLEEIRNNERGKFKDQAEAKLKKFNISKKTDAYKAYAKGILPPAHIHARAKRYAVKLFLAHLHHVMHLVEFKKDPPNPYPMGILGHDESHYIGVPNLNMVLDELTK